jgi:cytochrome c oxidase assembly protein Cox11
MKIEKLITEAAAILGIEAPKKSSNRNILFRCANLALTNIACNYRECVVTETFDVVNGRINFTDFNEPCYKIKSCSHDYEIFMGYLCVPNGLVSVTYATIPIYKRQSDKVTKFGIVTESILLYGMLTEYAQIAGLKDEVKIFEAQFERLLFAHNTRGRARRMP